MSNSLFGELYEELEDPITVVLRKRLADNEYEDHEVASIRQRFADETESDAFLPGTVKKFFFWRDNLDAADLNLRPRRDDIVVENPLDPGEVQYTIFRVRVTCHGERYECWARENVGEETL